ncbi:MAG: TonB-dependent receptor [Gammaproteobacteria bacterium]|nr:TonB-dependent receptor [Gammaproteobacteria bacterium]
MRCDNNSAALRVHWRALPASGLALALAAWLTPPAHAEATTSGDAIDQLEEVTVTARYKKEEVQTVPISMTVLSGADLAKQGYTSAVEATQGMPNVMLTPTGQQAGNAIGVAIRGVGQNDFALTVQPGVGTYVDGVYQGTLFGAQFGLLDVASLQVLRGPQGTLSGRNSEGGALQIQSVQPQGSGTGYAELGYGDYSHQIARGAYDFSIVPERVFLRVSAGLDKYDGYTNRLDYRCLHPGSVVSAQTAAPGCVLGTEGGDDVRSLRAVLRAIVSDNLEINLQGNVFDDNSDPAPSKTLQIVTALPNGSPTIAGLLNLTHPGLNYGSDFLTRSVYTNYDTFGDPLTGDSFSGRNYPAQNHLTAWGGSGTVDWRINDDMQLKSITAFQDYKGTFTSGSTAPLGSVNYQIISHRQFTQEVRLTGEAFKDALDWTVGGFLFSGRSVDAGENILSGLGNDFWQDEPATDANRSAFAHINYHLTGTLSLELGGRYSRDEESYTFNRYYVEPFIIPPVVDIPAGTPVVTPKRYNVGSSRWDYRAAVDEQWTPNVMSYVSVATGYKAGGINPRATSDATVTTFEPEQLTSYEMGVKTDWLDRRLQFDADAFFSDYRDLQLNTTQAVPNGFQVVYENVGVVHIYGVESELKARPTAALSFYANVGWLHYHAVDLGGAVYDPVNNTGGIIPGAPPPYTPSWKGGAGVEYRIPLGAARGLVSVRADESYQSRIYFDSQGTRAASQGNYGVLNLALAWQSHDEAWLTTLRVDNALDKQYWVSMTNTINPLGILAAQPSRPRMFTVTVRRNFD